LITINVHKENIRIRIKLVILLLFSLKLCLLELNGKILKCIKLLIYKETKLSTNNKLHVNTKIIGSILGSGLGPIFGSTVTCPYLAEITINLF
jgi:hypothetical protein